MEHKKHRGDRKDGIWLRDLPAVNQLMPGLMPNRADNEAFLQSEIDLRPMAAYLEQINQGRTEDKYTFFHLICCAMAKAFVLRPRMNRFICNNRIYQRKTITVAFMVKKKFDDRAEEGMAYLEFDPRETLESFHGKIMKVIHETKREDVRDTSSDALEAASKLPHWVMMLACKLVLALDRHGKTPQSIIGSDPNHAAIFLTNLGSIGLDGGYHHLVNWGTNSCFVVVGRKKMTVTYDTDGTPDPHQVIPLGITLDERIADGYYYSGTLALLQQLLTHPELLELPADTPVEYSIKR